MTEGFELYLNGLILIFGLVMIAIFVIGLVIVALIPDIHGEDKVMFACFNDLNDYFKFRLDHDNKTDYKVVFPCPDLDISNLPKDESNK